MCLLIYLFGLVILLVYGGQCELTWDKVYGLLSAKLDKIILEQDVMKTDIKDLMTSITAANQQLGEVASFNQMLTFVQDRLDNMDSHVKDVAKVEVGQRTHLLRRGLEQEKAATQSRLHSIQTIQGDLQSRFQSLEVTQTDLKSKTMTIESQVDTTRGHLSRLQQTLGKCGIS
ncbi:hypothetical protein DPMN_160974 [Dreissena polymorpha]|uniref:Uncharacterized protein n=1 Tax=Dreissena polymorpha TaxID=45954 RepID=A0A9D4ES94_DREPO|nr:hypothetical protein DPMN_160974 [Dreissena polymorpha]